MPPTPERPQAPYVGLRPYTEAQRSLFFGRDRDATLLRNKIFAAPLTVLYALSGVGKSSLLRTLVVPLLRGEDAHVVYCDSWADDDPIATVTHELTQSLPAELAAGAGIPRSGSLAEVARVVAGKMDVPIILVLDQFEELLLRRADVLEPLGAEIGALVRGEPNVHVVLSLREEFLASLEVLRNQIVTLLSSTYRLRPLDDAGVREAIVRPAELCGGSVEPALVDALIADLQSNSQEREHPTAGVLPGQVELPFLQLVCERLWDAAAVAQHRLTLDHFQQLDGVRGIMQDYVHGLTDPLPRARRTELARLLNLLAPRSGAKMAYAAEDVSDTAGVPPARVAELLDHLAAKYVVRVRPTARTKWYELYHDAFIRVLRPWVDRELARAIRRRWRRRAVTAAGAGVILVSLVVATIWWMRERTHTTDRIHWLVRQSPDSQRLQADLVADEVAHWILARADSANVHGKVATLLDLLAQASEPIGRFYARETHPEALMVPSAPQTRASPGATSRADAPEHVDTIRTCRVAATVPCGVGSALHLTHGARVHFHEQHLADAWRDGAKFLADSLGLPPPSEIIVTQDPSMHPDVVTVDLSGMKFDLSRFVAESALVAEQQLSGPVRQELTSTVHEGWVRVPSAAPGGSWWRVPRWTLPLWRAAGHRAYYDEQMLELALVTRLTAQPDLLLTPKVVARLVSDWSGRAAWPGDARRHPDSVAAVLIALARTGHSIRDGAGLLAALVRDPGGPHDNLPVRVWRAAVEASCQAPQPGRLAAAIVQTHHTGAEVEEALRALPGLPAPGDARHRRLQVCLIQKYVAEGRFAAADTEFAALGAAAAASWTTDEQYALGYWMARRAGANRSGEPTVGTSDYLQAAFRDWTNASAEAVYTELRTVCNEVWVARRCWATLDSMVALRPTSFWLALRFGYDLGQRRLRAQAQEAVRVLDRAEQLLQTQPTSVRPGLRAWIVLGRAVASHTLAQYGDAEDLRVTAAGLEQLLAGGQLGRGSFPDEWSVRRELYTDHVLAGRWEDARAVLLGARERDASPYVFFQYLAGDHLDSAALFAERTYADDGDPSALFRVSLTRLLTERADADSAVAAFFQTDHVYRDYVRLTLFWSLSNRQLFDSARALISSRWAQIDSATWRARAQRGDESVWREMLVGYYAGAVSREDIFAPLVSAETFAISRYRSLGSPLTGLRCEAYFYDALLQASSRITPPDMRRARVIAALDSALSTRHVLYYEYHMARILRSRYPQGAPRASPVFAPGVTPSSQQGSRAGSAPAAVAVGWTSRTAPGHRERGSMYTLR